MKRSFRYRLRQGFTIGGCTPFGENNGLCFTNHHSLKGNIGILIHPSDVEVLESPHMIPLQNRPRGPVVFLRAHHRAIESGAQESEGPGAIDGHQGIKLHGAS